MAQVLAPVELFTRFYKKSIRGPSGPLFLAPKVWTKLWSKKMKPFPTREQWQETIENLPAKLIFIHPAVRREDLFNAIANYPDLGIVLHWYQVDMPILMNDETEARVAAIKADLEKGHVVFCNSLIDIVNIFRREGLKFILAYMTHAGITSRALAEGHCKHSVDLWHYATGEYNTFRDPNIVKVAGGPGAELFSILSVAHQGPK